MGLTKDNVIDEISMISNKSKKDRSKICVSFYFEYTEDGKSRIEQFRYAQAEIDEDIKNTMIERLVRTFSKSVIENCDFEQFDILKNNKSTIYYMDDSNNLFDTARKVIDKLNDTSFTPEEDLTVLAKMKKVKGTIVKVQVEVDGKEEVFYLFMKLDTFNIYKEKNWKKGIFATYDKKNVCRITDSDTFFGIKNEIGFYYHDNHFVINNHTDFERMLFLNSVYKKEATKKATFLKNYLSTFPNVDNLVNDVAQGKGSSILARMVARISQKDISNKFSGKNIDKTLKQIDGIINDVDLKSNFKKIKIDKTNKQIKYTGENKYEFVSLLSDRPAVTLFLGKKFIE